MELRTQFAVLGTSIQILTNDKALNRRIQDIRVRAYDPIYVSRDLTIKVPKRNEEYVILEGKEMLVSAPDAEWITLYLNELINLRISQHWEQLIKIHAASGSYKGRRFLLVGDKGAGKTTLMTRLLLEDVTAFGDETVLLQGTEILPFPRKFHLKEGTLPLVPQLAPICNKMVSYPAYYGGWFFFFDPTDAGFEWSITQGKVRAIFFLEPYHGKTTHIERCPDWLMVQKLMLQASDFAENPESQLGHLCQVVDASDNYTIYLGGLDQAVAMIKEILA